MDQDTWRKHIKDKEVKREEQYKGIFICKVCKSEDVGACETFYIQCNNCGNAND